MSELKTYICPNCGAPTTNTQNCEFCGSLLVRFVEKGIDLSKTSYTNDSETFPGLAKEFENNLALQKQGDECVATDIYTSKEHALPGTNGNLCSILRTGMTAWQDDELICLTNNKSGLCVLLDFSKVLNDSDYDKYNQRQERLLSAFMNLDCYQLFTPHRSFFKKDADKMEGIEFAIDFGSDTEGAARLVSEILVKVYGLSLDEKIECYTNYGDKIDECREKINEERCYGDFSLLQWGVLFFVVFFAYLIMDGWNFSWWQMMLGEGIVVLLTAAIIRENKRGEKLQSIKP